MPFILQYKNWKLVLHYRVFKSSLTSWRQVHKNKDKVDIYDFDENELTI